MERRGSNRGCGGVSWTEKVVLVAAFLLVAVSLINPGGTLFALVLALAVLVAYYGGRELWDLEKSRQMGSKARDRDTRDMIRQDSADSGGSWWRRD